MLFRKSLSRFLAVLGAVLLLFVAASDFSHAQCSDDPVAQGYTVDIENNDCPTQGGICSMVVAKCPFDMD